MAISGVSAYASQVVSQSPTVRSTDGGSRVSAVSPVEQETTTQQTAQQEQAQTQNTTPTDSERQEAVQAGRTRGSFVNITA